MYSHRLLRLQFIPLLMLIVACAGCNAKKDVAQLTPGVANKTPGVTETRPNETYTRGAAPAEDRDVSSANNRGRNNRERQPANRESSRPTAEDRDRNSVPAPAANRRASSEEETVVPDEEDREAPRAKRAVGSTPAVGEPIKPITGADVDGVEFSLSEYSGKVTMIDFWGDW